MTVKERELTFTSAAPLRAWRLFRVRTCDDGFVLSSPMYHDPDPTPWPHIASTAVCYKDHRAPSPGCRCGIYAVIPGVLDSLPDLDMLELHVSARLAVVVEAAHDVRERGRQVVSLRGR